MEADTLPLLRTSDKSESMFNQSYPSRHFLRFIIAAWRFLRRARNFIHECSRM